MCGNEVSIKSRFILAILSATLGMSGNTLATGINVNSGFEDLKRHTQLESLDARTRAYYAGTVDFAA